MATANYRIEYEGKDITRDITAMVTGFSYTDKVEGESDEIEIALKNDSLIWLGDWRPQKKDKIKAVIIDEEGRELNCGTFTVDEATGSGGRDTGDIFNIKALAAGVTDPIRTKRTVAHENKTLQEIINKIASRHGYTVKGTIASFKIKYISQVRESDMQFLHKLGMIYGYAFSIRSNSIIFTPIKDLHTAAEVLTIVRDKETDYSFSDKITEIYNQSRVRHRHSSKKTLITKTVNAQTDSADTLEVHAHVDDEQQAEIVADNKLYRKNLQQVEFTLNNLPGNIYLVAGNNVIHSGWSSYDGKYCIKETTHVITRDKKYTTSYTANKL